MTNLVTSRNSLLTLTALILVGAGLALLRTLAVQGLTIRTVTASLLALSFIIFTFGGVLYVGRAFLNWQINEGSSHLIWERGFVIGGVLAAALGLALLDDMLRAAGDPVLSRLGMVAYLVGAVVVIAAETTYLGKRDWVYPQIVLYVIVAFLAQAAFGAALLNTGLVAGWVGWVTIGWNLGCLLLMVLVRPSDIYFPVLHHVAPLVIGIALLTQR